MKTLVIMMAILACAMIYLYVDLRRTHAELNRLKNWFKSDEAIRLYRGEKGDAGKRGERGPIGDVGPKGADGKDGHVTRGTLTGNRVAKLLAEMKEVDLSKTTIKVKKIIES